jgi:uncharacterized protein (DUF2336 family)
MLNPGDSKDKAPQTQQQKIRRQNSPCAARVKMCKEVGKRMVPGIEENTRN